MGYIKDDLYNASLPILIVEKEKRYIEYSQIGFGDERSLHKYNEKITFKTFDFISKKDNVMPLSKGVLK